MDFLTVLEQPLSEWSAHFGVILPIQWPEFILKARQPQRQVLEQLYRNRMALWVSTQPEINPKRPIVRPEQLESKENELYQALLKQGNLEEKIIKMHATAPRVSGRILDSLVTKYPRHVRAIYYIDTNQRYCGSHKPAEVRKSVDLGLAYKAQIRKYSKNCFDPFGRGHDLLHETKDGRCVLFSLCKFMFHCWAERNHVYSYLAEHYEEVTRVQREDQQRLRPKNKKKRLRVE